MQDLRTKGIFLFRPGQRLCRKAQKCIHGVQKCTPENSLPVSASQVNATPKIIFPYLKVSNNFFHEKFYAEKSILQSQDALANKPLAGRLRFHKNERRKLTSDKTILDIVRGYKIDFMLPPVATSVRQPCFTQIEEKALQKVIEDLLEKQVIERSTHEPGEFISPVFLRPKNGKLRLILNLKKLNENIPPIHFKMDTIQSCINLMKKNCFMASLDIVDAYYAVSIHPTSQKYLKFQVGTQLYKYIALPNGLCSAPRIFTKLMKPVYSALRARGLISSGYLDDSFLLGMSYE